MRGINKTNPGATALVIVLLTGMALMTMAGGIVALTLREQRQATNTDQSNRAIQTAGSAVRLASQIITDNPDFIKKNIDICGEDKIKDTPIAKEFNNIFSAQDNQQVTCLFVGNQLKSYEGSLQQDRATQVMVTDTIHPDTGAPVAQKPYYMQLRWHSDTLDRQLADYTKSVFYPAVNDYDAAAAIEITFVRWPKAGLVTASSGLPTETVFLMPGQDDKSQPTNSVTSGCDKGGAGSSAGNYGDYRCVTNPNSSQGFEIGRAIRLTNADDAQNYDYAIRVKTRYTGTHFQLRIFSKDNQELVMQSSKAVIDATARSGNLYRRVRAEKIVIPSALEDVSDAVLFSNEGGATGASGAICKGLVVKENDKTLAPANTPSCKQY